MFHRRRNRSFKQSLKEVFYPRGGWKRTAQYVWYRLRRLPDAPHRIARGVAAGVFISFTPFFGFHLIGAGMLAWLFGGNVIAALLATLIGNPITFPFIAVAAVTLGRNLLGLENSGGATRIVSEIGRATGDLGNNILSLISSRDAEWGRLAVFFHDVFVPYILGGVLLGLLAAAVAHILTVPLIRAYQRHRSDRRARRHNPTAAPAQPPAAKSLPEGNTPPATPGSKKSQ